MIYDEVLEIINIILFSVFTLEFVLRVVTANAFGESYSKYFS